MTLLTAKRISALYRAAKAGNTSKVDAILLEGAHIQWKIFLGHENARDRRRKRRERAEKRHAEQRAKDKAKHLAHERWRIKRDMAASKRRHDETIVQGVIQLITEKKVTINHRFMKSIKDPGLKRKVIEATCLSKV